MGKSRLRFASSTSQSKTLKDCRAGCTLTNLCTLILSSIVFILMPFAFVFGWFCITLIYLRQANFLQTTALLMIMPNQVVLIKIVR